MTHSALSLSHAQFFLSLGFMLLFLALELGLAWVLLYFKLRTFGSNATAWMGAYRFWVRLFALAFILSFAASMPVLKVILPIGISFYTFQSMSYTIDVYRGRAAAMARSSSAEALSAATTIPSTRSGPPSIRRPQVPWSCRCSRISLARSSDRSVTSIWLVPA